MRRLNIFLLAGLQLCRARQPSFSIHDDVLAYPQFEVVFSELQISESEALALVEGAHPTYVADSSSQTDLTGQIRESSAADAAYASGTDADDGAAQVSETYEIIHLPPSRYLCSVPVLAPPAPPNQTANELAKAEEARELSRAFVRGWEIMNDLDGHCLYFMSGWWSYSFCYNRDVVQFHALPNGHKSGMPPVRDPQSQEYVLGRVHYDTPPHKHQPAQPNQRHQRDGSPDADDTPATTSSSPPTLPAPPPNSELADKDNQRYLVQRLDGGTLCDLTGRERTIEVQYHCHPGIPGDRIGWIKEVTTCTYLMVVQTPRLCADVAFLPPKEGRAHPVTCQPIGDGDSSPGGGVEGMIAAAAEHAAEIILGAATDEPKPPQPPTGGKAKNKHAGQTIGGVVVGGRALLGTGADGKPAARLPAPRHLGGGRAAAGSGGGAAEAVVEVLARGSSKAAGGRVEALTREELQRLDLSPEAVEELRRELQQQAGDHAWKLEVVEVPGEVLEIRGVVEPDEEGEGGGGGGKMDKEGARVQKTRGGDKEKERARQERKERDRRTEEEEDEEEGSQETFYRDEL